MAARQPGSSSSTPDAGAPWHPRALYLATHPHSALPTLRAVIGARKAVYTVPDEHVTTRLDVTRWLEKKVAAVLAHHSEVERGALPGLVASLPPAAQEKLLSTEWYIRCGSHSPLTTKTELTVSMNAG